MARIPMYDPKTSEARSPLIAGLSDACSKLSEVLDLTTETDEITLENLVISDDDKNRIYQAPIGKKLWLSYPYPVIKKNGIEITEFDDSFSIDFVGGSIAFNNGVTLGDDDVVTAEVSRIGLNSNKLNYIFANIESLEESTRFFKGLFNNVESLESEYSESSTGDFAFVVSEEDYNIYIFNEVWVPVFAPDITSEEVSALWDGPVQDGFARIMSHEGLSGRDGLNQHPIEAISGFNEATNEEILSIWKGI